MNLKTQIGIFKSRIIYDFKPFNKRRLYRFYGRFIKKGDLCFDIGAHTGNRTGSWLRIGAKVVSVEPHPVFAKLLHSKYGHHDDFILLNKAVSNETGEAELHISSINPTLSTLSGDWKKVINDIDSRIEWDKKTRVPLTTLDEMIRDYGMPAFCKIDVEGLEEKVLKGVSKPLPSLSFEFFPTTPGQTIKCLDILSSLGNYEFNWIFTERFRFISPDWLPYEDIKQKVENYTGKLSGDIYARLLI